MSAEVLPRSSHLKDIVIAVLVAGILSFTQGIKWAQSHTMQNISLTTPTTITAPPAPAPK